MNEREVAILKQEVARLSKMLEQLMQPKSVARLIVPDKSIIRVCKNGATAIAARSGSTLSSQNCTLYSTAGGTLTAQTPTIAVRNLSTTAVAADAYIIALWDGESWLAGWEDC